MKANRIIDHRQRIRRVAAYIDEHIDDKLNLQSLAAVACLSPFHFQRVYQQLVGETPADTVRRLRLARAATQIARGEISVTEAALVAGYGSSQAFCRAFRRRFGIAPSHLKRTGQPWLAKRQPSQPDFSLIELPAQIGYGLRHAGTDWECGWSSCQVIGRAFADGAWTLAAGQLFTQYRTDPLADINAAVDADICITGDERSLAPLGLERIVLAGGAFAALRLDGSLQQSIGRAQILLQKNLPAAGMVRRAAPLLRRVLKDMALTPPSEWMSELYVPVEHRVDIDRSVDSPSEAATSSSDFFRLPVLQQRQ